MSPELVEFTCSVCWGTGETDLGKCQECRGTGVVREWVEDPGEDDDEAAED